MKLKRMMAAVLVAGVLAGTAQTSVKAADNASQEMTWYDSFNAWAFYYVQSTMMYFGYCYSDITGKACIKP